MIKLTQKGFTLIEVMIVVAIIGIIAGVAMPSYTQYVIKSKRADAKIELLRIAQLQEKFFTQNLSYAKTLNGAASIGGLGMSAAKVLTENGHYKVEIASEPSTCTGTTETPCTGFTLTAKPQGGQLNDSKCENFTLTNTGVKDVSVTGHGQTCWN